MKIIQNEHVFRKDCGIKLYTLRSGQQGWPGAAHGHTYFQLWYVRSGKCRHEIGGGTYTLCPGELLFVPPYAVHNISAENEGCCIYGCDISCELLAADPVLKEQTQDRIGLSTLQQVQGKYALTDAAWPRAEIILGKMLAVYRKQDPYMELELKGYLLRLLAVLFRSLQGGETACSGTDAYTENIEDAIAYTSEHIAERILLKEAAACAKMSVSSFSHYFRKYTGQTYVEYTNMLRLDVAKKLLTETGLSITAIAAQVGCPNAAYFSRLFRRSESCTPGEYRVRNRQKTNKQQ